MATGHCAEAAQEIQAALAAVGPDDVVTRGRLLELRTRLVVTASIVPVSLAMAEELGAHARLLVAAEPALAVRLFTEAALVATVAGARVPALSLAEEAVARSAAADDDAADDDGAAAMARLMLGMTLAFTGAQARAIPLLAGAESLQPGHDVVEAVHYLQYVVLGLAAAERYATALALAGRIVGAARAMRAEGVLPLALSLLAHSAYFTADFTTTRLAAEEASTSAADLGQAGTICYAYVCQLMAAAAAGDVEEGKALAAKALELLPTVGTGALLLTVNAGLGLLAISDQRYTDAVTHYAEVDRLVQVQGVGDSGMLHWRENWVEALARSGRREAAERELRRLAASADCSPWRSAAVDRCRGLLADSAPAARMAYDAALAQHEHAASVFETGRTHLYLAEQLLEVEPTDPAAAAEHLAAAHQAFSQSGARAWLVRTEQLQCGLRLTAPRPAADAGLTTPYELRLLGGFALARGGRPTPRPAELHTRALVAVCLAGGRLPVDELVEELWPGEPPGAGRTRLRNVLARLRGRYGPLLCRDGAAVRLDGTVTVDVLEFSRDAHRALTGDRGDPATVEAARRAVARYRGELLPADRHVESTAAPRERLRRQLLALLDLLAQDARGRGDLSAAAEWLDQAITVEPYDLARYPQLAGLLTVLGREADARRVLARADAAHTELGVPSPAEPPAVERRPGRLSR